MDPPANPCAITGYPRAVLFAPCPGSRGVYASPVIAASAYAFLLSFIPVGEFQGFKEYAVVLYTDDPTLGYLRGASFLSEEIEGIGEHRRRCGILAKGFLIGGPAPMRIGPWLVGPGPNRLARREVFMGLREEARLEAVARPSHPTNVPAQPS